LTRFERSTVIQAPVEKVFAFATDLDNFMRTSPPEMEMKLLSRDEGPTRVGQKAKVKAKAGGQVWEAEIETMEYVKNKKHTVRQSGGALKKLTMTHLFEPADGGTRFTWITEYELPYSLLGKVVDVLKVRKDMEKGTDYSMAKIKELIEKR
jgi:ligand-binding SRPBCC domain-containing protein